jgi:hypothetical protein
MRAIAFKSAPRKITAKPLSRKTFPEKSGTLTGHYCQLNDSTKLLHRSAESTTPKSPSNLWEADVCLSYLCG